MIDERLPWKKLLAREGVDITTISGVDQVFVEMAREFTGAKEELFFTSFEKKHFTHYIGVDAKTLGLYLQKKYFPDEETIEQQYRDGQEYLATLPNTVAEWAAKITGTEPAWDELTAAHAKFKEEFAWVCRIYSIQSWLAIEAWQGVLDAELGRMIEATGNAARRDQIIATVYRPWKKTALMEIQARLSSGEDPEALLEEYQFLRSWSAVWFRPLDRRWIDSLRAPASHATPEYLSPAELVDLLKPTADQAAMIRLAPYLIFFKDWRDDLRRAQVFHWSFLFDAMARMLGVERDDLGYFTLDELSAALAARRVDQELLARRKMLPCVITIIGGEQSVRVIEPVPPAYTSVVQQVDRAQVTDLVKGSIAYPGIISGRVRLLNTFHDIKKVQEGDILVANTTHPNYLSGMKLAAAFVTNEGGIISHAAIVAREMKKPCIVGTKNATKVLKDGDMVEVDADKGVVRKIG